MRTAGLLAALALTAACGGAARSDTLRSPLDATRIEGIGRCDAEHGVALEADRPLTVLVHGNHAAVDYFAVLARALEARGQQVVCYRWKEKGRLTRAAHDLREALVELDRLHLPRLQVLGHSLGGLVARRALVRLADEPPLETPTDLVTVATPFAGVRSARTCGRTLLRVVSLGVVASICRRLARGAKWRDIHPEADLIEDPGELGPWVRSHLHVITRERGHCRRRVRSGRCVQDDQVFRPEEQTTEHITDPRLRTTTVDAGHGAVVGDAAALPGLFAAIDGGRS